MWQQSKPAEQGPKTRAVRGRQRGWVTEWKGYFGWIEPEEAIDHAEAGKHGGRVYINSKDIKANSKYEIYEGARVSFYVYADGNGMGAEELKVEDEGWQQLGGTEQQPPKPAAVAPRTIPGMAPDMLPKTRRKGVKKEPPAVAGSSATNGSVTKSANSSAVVPPAPPVPTAPAVRAFDDEFANFIAPPAPLRSPPPKSSAGAPVRPPPMSNMGGGIATALRGGIPQWSQASHVSHRAPPAQATQIAPPDSIKDLWKPQSDAGQWHHTQPSSAAGNGSGNFLDSGNGWQQAYAVQQQGDVPDGIKNLWGSSNGREQQFQVLQQNEVPHDIRNLWGSGDGREEQLHVHQQDVFPDVIGTLWDSEGTAPAAEQWSQLQPAEEWLPLQSSQADVPSNIRNLWHSEEPAAISSAYPAAPPAAMRLAPSHPAPPPPSWQPEPPSHIVQPPPPPVSHGTNSAAPAFVPAGPASTAPPPPPSRHPEPPSHVVPPPPPPMSNGTMHAAAPPFVPAAYAPASAADTGAADEWWHALDDSCPISLESMRDLAYEPFGLLGSTSEGLDAPTEGVWGATALAATRDGTLGAIHWFDGMFLASFLVSSSQFIDVVSRRPLSRGECVSLDEYLAVHALPAVHVTDAFDLSQLVAGQGTSSAGNPGSRDRVSALEREAAAMLRSLFDFRSNSRAPPPPPPMKGAATQNRIGPRTGLGGGASLEMAEEWPDAASASQGYRGNGPSYTQRTVHSDAGLRVVDDGEFDEVVFDGDAAGSSNPTPAEALRLNRAAASRPAKATRPPKAHRLSAQAPAQKNQTDVVQVSFSLSAGRGRGQGTSSSQGRGNASGSTDAVVEADDMPVCNVWVPDWATPELHDRLLVELQVAEAAIGENLRVSNPDMRAYLEDCACHRRTSASPNPLLVEVLHHIDGGSRGLVSCVIQFSLSPFYPMHRALLSLRPANEVEGALGGLALERLQQLLRDEVVAPLVGSEAILPTLQWLSQHGAAELARLTESVAREAQQASDAVSAASSEQVQSKRERVEEARKERMCSKFSGNMDLCYAFVKHGHCKDKSCQWSHEVRS